ncbi:hypothetical protein [Piscibacillus halophilus]|uniref:Uncharacterized protein n=1 Tax=Piscibacillus halophilus TaxID=571933 RepID=A0A1H9EGT3_9BACI|nr:hypothetical protein [Piscibacillus halophilus]SEQ24859.1 hypothetical protein SAMN05216362_10960 [Piscibacillus halophilus]
MKTQTTHCPSCSELKKYVDQQGELISQLMRMMAQTHEKVTIMEQSVQKLKTEKEVKYSYSISGSNQSSICQRFD